MRNDFRADDPLNADGSVTELALPWIRPLPERLVNKIAAGEVIERPASVVKELVENAIDARATQIEVIIEKAGITRIEVHDNGVGISSEQLEIAFSRHATSKIANFDDLESVGTFGFRGEALPSIASVSRLRMISKSRAEDHATEIVIEGGVVREVRPAHRADGSSVIIEDLFFNTPARKKFLKSETTESRQIARAATAQALGALNVGLKVKLNGRTLFSFSPDDSLMTRAARLLGVTVDSLLPLEVNSGAFSLYGVLGKPDIARRVRSGLHLFVNGRALRASPLMSAIRLGYGELLAAGLFPTGVFHLEVDSKTVDVNVHPAKSEVRLSEEREAHDFVRRAVRETLRGADIVSDFGFASGPSVNLSSRGVLPEPTRVENGEALRDGSWRANSAACEENGLSATESLFGADTPSSAESSNRTGESIPVDISEMDFRYLGQFANLYLLAQKGEDLYLIDQHAGHERILYEEIMESMQREAALGQRLLFPPTVELSADGFLAWQEHKDELTKVGFESSHLGGRTVLLDSAPSVLRNKNPERALVATLDDLERLQKGGYSPMKAVAQSLACRSAVMAGDPLEREAAMAIIHRLLACEGGYSCPHGRPTFVKISRYELDRRFGRV